MHLDLNLIDRMAGQGTALVPTLTAFSGILADVRTKPPGPRRGAIRHGWDHLMPTIRAAHGAGVTVLAGTDSEVFGQVSTEVGWLVKAGLSAGAAVAAASWTARSWPGLPGLVDGAPADLVVFDGDPPSTRLCSPGRGGSSSGAA
ncbi:hypothetical protein AOZ06_23700 [Kibdelosporangium phytohabitans]|uniref:Amidohydrolase-related domain-containing protein n=2 Tax=Kibdelosporangium phytohabitans TaxID=860235 RepID=A0A0N9HW56_9PSEU|nr:hypothetical protein AOZ06_23700 [Kibdelosporangium phytohabitans]